MNGQNIKKYLRKQEIIFFSLPRDKRWENWVRKNELIFYSEDKMKPNTTEFSFFYYNG